jgi:hypothetical protein
LLVTAQESPCRGGEAAPALRVGSLVCPPWVCVGLVRLVGLPPLPQLIADDCYDKGHNCRSRIVPVEVRKNFGDGGCELPTECSGYGNKRTLHQQRLVLRGGTAVQLPTNNHEQANESN